MVKALIGREPEQNIRYWVIHPNLAAALITLTVLWSMGIGLAIGLAW